jgi:hypothetical protein
LAEYRYVGTECFYPNIIIPGEGSLVAKPGDVREFDNPPDRTWWVPVEPEPKPKTAKPDAKEVK